LTVVGGTQPSGGTEAPAFGFRDQVMHCVAVDVAEAQLAGGRFALGGQDFSVTLSSRAISHGF
jgi:hypothetical protein